MKVSLLDPRELDLRIIDRVTRQAVEEAVVEDTRRSQIQAGGGGEISLHDIAPGSDTLIVSVPGDSLVVYPLNIPTARLTQLTIPVGRDPAQRGRIRVRVMDGATMHPIIGVAVWAERRDNYSSRWYALNERTKGGSWVGGSLPVGTYRFQVSHNLDCYRVSAPDSVRIGSGARMTTRVQVEEVPCPYDIIACPFINFPVLEPRGIFLPPEPSGEERAIRHSIKPTPDRRIP